MALTLAALKMPVIGNSDNELVELLASESGYPLGQPSYVISEVELSPLLAEEVSSEESLFEGAVRRITVNAYERDRRARSRCIAHYGTECAACGLSFEKLYGGTAAGIIHVHHIVSLSEIGTEYRVDPVRDLRPVCPNCHAVIHSTQPPLSVEEVAAMVREQRSG
jgi:5-methylcytosine-specific restriction enzyme A